MSTSGICWSDAALAVSLKVASTGGVMQQPTSHYYLAIYGGFVEVASDSGAIIGRAQYLERPEFNHSGFTDKDFGTFAQIGTKLTKAANHGLFAFIGGGHMQGYVRADAEMSAGLSAAERGYVISGPTASVEYAYRWQHVDVALGHQTFIGYADRSQTEAYVAWPFNFFQASVGVLW